MGRLEYSFLSIVFLWCYSAHAYVTCSALNNVLINDIPLSY